MLKEKTSLILLFGISLALWSAGCDQADVNGTNPTMGSAVQAVDVIDPMLNGIRFSDGHGGKFASTSSQGSINLNNPFFQSLGTNGRRCVVCHVPDQAWTITPEKLQQLADESKCGTKRNSFKDPFDLEAVLRVNDGANSPDADLSLIATSYDECHNVYSMLLDKGLIRVGLPMPAPAIAEFELAAVDDPHHFASATQLSLFRRPLPTANLKFDSTVMWDGREVVPGQTVPQELSTQSDDATTGHAQATTHLSPDQQQAMVDFEIALASAQVVDPDAGDLTAIGAKGGPDAILAQPFYVGINDNFGDSQTHAPFSPIVFNLYDAWAQAGGQKGPARQAVARGQAIFNNRGIAISGVSGINNEAAFGKIAVLMGTCTSCHDTPNGGNHSVVAPLNIGLADASRRADGMPLYTFRCSILGVTNGSCADGDTVQLTDGGRGLIDGKWSHLGRFKGPMLRNLAPRAPYFHNGFAGDLDAVVNFYNDRFTMNLSPQEHADLAAFLRTL